MHSTASTCQKRITLTKSAPTTPNTTEHCPLFCIPIKNGSLLATVHSGHSDPINPHPMGQRSLTASYCGTIVMVSREGPDLCGHPSVIDAGMTPTVACRKHPAGHSATISLNLSLSMSLKDFSRGSTSCPVYHLSIFILNKSLHLEVKEIHELKACLVATEQHLWGSYDLVD